MLPGAARGPPGHAEQRPLSIPPTTTERAGGRLRSPGAFTMQRGLETDSRRRPGPCTHQNFGPRSNYCLQPPVPAHSRWEEFGAGAWRRSRSFPYHTTKGEIIPIGHVGKLRHKVTRQTCLGPAASEWQGQETSPAVLVAACPASIPWEEAVLLCGMSLCLFSLSQDHQYGVPASGTRDKDGFPRLLRTPGPTRYCPTAEGAQSSTRKVGSHYWQAKGSPRPHMPPDPGSPRLARNTSLLTDGRATRVHPSPFGVPYSKLSQSKHLKARMGGSQWASSDSKRGAQAPQDRKDP